MREILLDWLESCSYIEIDLGDRGRDTQHLTDMAHSLIANLVALQQSVSESVRIESRSRCSLRCGTRRLR